MTATASQIAYITKLQAAAAASYEASYDRYLNDGLDSELMARMRRNADGYTNQPEGDRAAIRAWNEARKAEIRAERAEQIQAHRDALTVDPAGLTSEQASHVIDTLKAW